MGLWLSCLLCLALFILILFTFLFVKRWKKIRISKSNLFDILETINYLPDQTNLEDLVCLADSLCECLKDISCSSEAICFWFCGGYSIPFGSTTQDIDLIRGIQTAVIHCRELMEEKTEEIPSNVMKLLEKKKVAGIYKMKMILLTQQNHFQGILLLLDDKEESCSLIQNYFFKIENMLDIRKNFLNQGKVIFSCLIEKAASQLGSSLERKDPYIIYNILKKMNQNGSLNKKCFVLIRMEGELVEEKIYKNISCRLKLEKKQGYKLSENIFLCIVEGKESEIFNFIVTLSDWLQDNYLIEIAAVFLSIGDNYLETLHIAEETLESVSIGEIQYLPMNVFYERSRDFSFNTMYFQEGRISNEDERKDNTEKKEDEIQNTNPPTPDNQSQKEFDEPSEWKEA